MKATSPLIITIFLIAVTTVLSGFLFFPSPLSIKSQEQNKSETRQCIEWKNETIPAHSVCTQSYEGKEFCDEYFIQKQICTKEGLNCKFSSTYFGYCGKSVVIERYNKIITQEDCGRDFNETFELINITIPLCEQEREVR